MQDITNFYDIEEVIDVEEGDLVMYVNISAFDVICQEYIYSWQNLIKGNKTMNKQIDAILHRK